MRSIAFLLVLFALPVVGGCALLTITTLPVDPWLSDGPDRPDVADRAPPKSNLKPPLDFEWTQWQWERHTGIPNAMPDYFLEENYRDVRDPTLWRPDGYVYRGLNGNVGLGDADDSLRPGNLTPPRDQWERYTDDSPDYRLEENYPRRDCWSQRGGRR